GGPGMATAPGRACVADRRFPVFRLLSHCYFLGPIGGESRSRRLHARPQIAGGKLTSWRHDGSRLGPARTCATEKKKFHGWGVAAVVFFIVVYNAGCGGARLRPKPKI